MTYRLACFAMLLGPAAVACSSSGTAGDAGLGPKAGRSGNSQDGGEGGRAGSAGGIIRSSNATGGIGSSASLDAAEVCRQAVQAQIDRLAVCQAISQDGIDDALGLANACPDDYFNPDSNRTVEAMVDCLPALRARTCTDVILGIMPLCFPSGGKRPDGTSCAFSSQCKSGLCSSGDKTCGACMARERLAGEACQYWRDCVAGLHCSLKGVCVANGTPSYATEGQACDLDGSPVVGCVGDLYCRFQAGTRAGTCVAPPGAAQPCANNGMGNGTICSASTTCVFGICRAPGGCGDGVSCDADSTCASSGTSLACAPRAKLGEDCSGGPQGRPCRAPGVCLGTAKCVIPRVVGEACDDTNPCDRYLLCVKGACQKMNAATCPP